MPEPLQHKPGTIESINRDETMLQVVHKHWFGLLVVYIELSIGFIAAALLLGLAAPVAFSRTDPAELRSNLIIIMAAGAIVTWLLMVLYTYIYRQNKLIITDQNLTQVIQRGLFSRKVSELSMADVEDVAADKVGPFAAILNFGALLVETAGATDNFEFNRCPKPDTYGKIVLDAREAYIGRGETE
jgi:hypothetical protein